MRQLRRTRWTAMSLDEIIAHRSALLTRLSKQKLADRYSTW